MPFLFILGDATAMEPCSVEHHPAHDAFMAALAALVVTTIWLLVAAGPSNRPRRAPLPDNFWIFAGSSVGLFVFGTVCQLRP